MGGRARKLRRLEDPAVAERRAAHYAVRSASDEAALQYGLTGSPPRAGLPHLPVVTAPHPRWAAVADYLSSGDGYVAHLRRHVAFAERAGASLLSQLSVTD